MVHPHTSFRRVCMDLVLYVNANIQSTLVLFTFRPDYCEKECNNFNEEFFWPVHLYIGSIYWCPFTLAWLCVGCVFTFNNYVHTKSYALIYYYIIIVILCCSIHWYTYDKSCYIVLYWHTHMSNLWFCISQRSSTNLLLFLNTSKYAVDGGQFAVSGNRH